MHSSHHHPLLSYNPPPSIIADSVNISSLPAQTSLTLSPAPPVCMSVVPDPNNKAANRSIADPYNLRAIWKSNMCLAKQVRIWLCAGDTHQMKCKGHIIAAWLIKGCPHAPAMGQ